MAFITKLITVDVAKENTFQSIIAKQYDTDSRFLKATLTNEGEQIFVSPTSSVTINALREDNSAKSFLGTVNEDGTVTVPLTYWMIELDGTVKCDISVIDSEQRKLTSTSFTINVEAASCSETDIIEDENYDILVSLIGKISEIQVPNGITQENGVLQLTANGEKVGDGVELPKTPVDSELSAESENPVQNKAIKAELKTKLSNSAGSVKRENLSDGCVSFNHIGEGQVTASAIAKNSIYTRHLADGQITEDKLSPEVVFKLNNAINSWKDVQNAVRLGLGANLFPVGYEFTTPDSTTGTDITWVVRGHDHHRPANSRLTHSMTLETKYVYSLASGTQRGLAFDIPEALYYCEEALPAGTYNFVWNHATGAVVNGTFQFTLTKAVPAGGQIVLGTKQNSTAVISCKISTYANVGATAAIESGIAITAGSGGTRLGTVNSLTSTNNNLNCGQRILFGSNNYAQSAVRQWMNSNAVWTPTNKFDRAPVWATNKDCFTKGLPANFLAVVEPAVIPCRTNSVYECASLDGTEYTVNKVYELQDKFFLLSRPEIYGTWDSASYKDGELLEYYEGLTDAERIKYDMAGTARTCLIRSHAPGHADDEHCVYISGALSNIGASNPIGITPACIIA